jgi:DNA-binding Xre family transcriptional regulator
MIISTIFYLFQLKLAIFVGKLNNMVYAEMREENMGKAEKVRILLVKRGNISEAELARRMEISPQALSRKMNKEKFTSTDMEKIAKILNCSWNIESREWFKMNDTGEEI